MDIYVPFSQLVGRQPDFAAEHSAVAKLVAELAEHPENILQKLADVAMDLTGADSAGVSLLSGNSIEWVAVAGLLAAARGTTLSTHGRPSGAGIHQDGVRLIRRPLGESPLGRLAPNVEEALLLPLHAHGASIGTLWLVSQTRGRTFDREDARVAGVLTRLTAAAWQIWRAGDVAAHDSIRKDEFIATLGHELRNPLSVLATAAAVIKVRSGDTAVQRSAEMIGRQCLHVSRLVDDLLDVARIQSGKLALNVEPIDLRIIVKNTLEERRSDVDRRKQVLTVTLARDPIFVNGDPFRLVQIVSNLLDNATKYTPEAGHIEVAVTADGSDAMVSIQDDGAGIPSDRLQSIFDPLVQLPESRGLARGGLGLGLTLVRRLAELHGGRVDVTSAGARRGSRFTVRLPARRPELPASQRQSSTGVTSAN